MQRVGSLRMLSRGRHKEVIQQLLEKDADINV